MNSLVPVTALSFVHTKGWASNARCRGDEEVLFAGRGDTVTVHSCCGEFVELQSATLLDTSAVHGFAVNGSRNGRYVAFGDKRGAVFKCSLGNVGEVDIQVEFDFGQLLDLVWDVSWINDSAVSGLAFGFAQGYIQLWERNQDGGWMCLQTILSQARCILYSLSFAPKFELETMWAAGGTVFGDLVLWRGADSEGRVSQRASGHHGPIFGLKWSENGDQVCTVGDDRTVRLWSVDLAQEGATRCIWSSFGHGARVWSSCFVNDRTLVTVGEDTQIRLWSRSNGELFNVLEGHLYRNVWCCAVSPDTGVIATGGSDSAIKLWDILREESPIRDTLMPASLAMRIQGEEKRPRLEKTFISNVAFLPFKEKVLLVVASNLSLYVLRNPFSAEAPDFQSIEPASGPFLPENVSFARCKALSSFWLKESESSLVAFGLENGFMIVSEFSAPLSCDAAKATKMTPHSAFGANESGFGILHSKLFSFDASQRQLGLVIMCADLVTRVWGYSVDSGWVERCSLVPDVVNPCRLTAACVFENDLLVVGDQRGNVHYTSLINLAPDKITSKFSTLPRLHGGFAVGCIEIHNGKVYTAGHNGIVMELVVRYDSIRSSGSNAVHMSVREIIRNPFFTTIQFLKWTPHLVIAGNSYHDFCVWDTLQESMILRDKHGAWKKSCALDVSPEHCFLFSALSTTKKQKIAAIGRLGRISTVSLPRLSLGPSFHARSIWACCWVFPGLLMTGCENGCLKLSRCTVDGVKVEATTTCNGAFRCMAKSSIDTSSVVLVTGSAEQVVRCWLVRDLGSTCTIEMLCEHVGNNQGDPTQRILGIFAWKIQASLPQEEKSGKQQHFGTHRIIVGNTMGEFAGFELREHASDYPAKFKHDPRFTMRGSLESLFIVRGDRPVRCLSGLQLSEEQGEIAVLAMLGRTDGSVEAWFVSGQMSTPVLLFKRAVHKNGVNSIGVARITDKGSITVVSGGDDQGLALMRLSSSTFMPEMICLIENAAGSAIRGLATDGARIWVGDLNQRLRTWMLTSEERENIGAEGEIAVEKLWFPRDADSMSVSKGSIKLVDEKMLEIAECHGVGSANGRVAIVGCGLQVVSSS